MRKIIFMIFATILASCAKNPESEELDERHGDEEMIEITISITGPRWGEQQTRGLDADGYELEDLWIFEKKDEGVSLVVHQSKNDLDFGSPKFKLRVGEKTLYIIASRGTQPTVDMDEMAISWLKPKDTFWASHEIEVSNNTSHIAVTLQRVVAKMEVSLSDLIPDNLATVRVHADEWRHGLFVMTGDMTSGISVDDTWSDNHDFDEEL